MTEEPFFVEINYRVFSETAATVHHGENNNYVIHDAIMHNVGEAM